MEYSVVGRKAANSGRSLNLLDLHQIEILTQPGLDLAVHFISIPGRTHEPLRVILLPLLTQLSRSSAVGQELPRSKGLSCHPTARDHWTARYRVTTSSAGPCYKPTSST